MQTAVVHEEAILFIPAIVAQKDLAGVAVPDGFTPLLPSVMLAVVAAVRFLCSSLWEVILTEPPS